MSSGPERGARDPDPITPIASIERSLAGSPRRFLVTGVAGFVGSHLLEALLGLDQEVIGLDDFSTGSASNLEDVRARVVRERWARFELLEGTLTEERDCARACAGVDAVLHQAALGSVPRSIDDPWASFEANVVGTARLLEAAREAGVRRVVYASSSSVYGDDPEQPRVESRLGIPLSPYAASKRMGEEWASSVSRSLGLETVGLRYFNLFGPRQDPGGPYAAVIPRWIAALSAGRPPELHGDGSTTRDFCPVPNAVQANLLAALAAPGSSPSDAVVGRSFNVGLGGSVPLLRLLSCLVEELERRGVPCAGLEPRRAPLRAGDVRHSRADLGDSERLLGYRPRMDFVEGIRWTCGRVLEVARGTALDGPARAQSKSRP